MTGRCLLLAGMPMQPGQAGRVRYAASPPHLAAISRLPLPAAAALPAAPHRILKIEVERTKPMSLHQCQLIPAVKGRRLSDLHKQVGLAAYITYAYINLTQWLRKKTCFRCKIFNRQIVLFEFCTLMRSVSICSHIYSHSSSPPSLQVYRNYLEICPKFGPPI